MDYLYVLYYTFHFICCFTMHDMNSCFLHASRPDQGCLFVCRTFFIRQNSDNAIPSFELNCISTVFLGKLIELRSRLRYDLFCFLSIEQLEINDSLSAPTFLFYSPLRIMHIGFIRIFCIPDRLLSAISFLLKYTKIGLIIRISKSG